MQIHYQKLKKSIYSKPNQKDFRWNIKYIYMFPRRLSVRPHAEFNAPPQPPQKNSSSACSAHEAYLKFSYWKKTHLHANKIHIYARRSSSKKKLLKGRAKANARARARVIICRLCAARIWKTVFIISFATFPRGLLLNTL